MRAWGVTVSMLVACASAPVAAPGEAPIEDPRGRWVASIASPNERFIVEERTVLLIPTSTRGVLSVTPGLRAERRVRVGAVFCEMPKPGERGEVRCTSEATPHPAPGSGIDYFQQWLEVMGQCGEVERFAPSEETVRRVAASVEATGRSGLVVEADDTVMVVELLRWISHREYDNECSNEREQRCDPISSWPTNRVSTFYVPTYEVVGRGGAAPFEYPFQRRGAPLVVPYPGARRDGWFVPHAAVGPPEADPAEQLARLAAYAPTDEDDALAVALLRASLAVEAQDPDVAGYARRFVDALERRSIADVHFELRRPVVAARFLMKAIADGELSGADPCPRRKRE